MKEVKSGEIGIKLPSCNYDTYVIQGDKKCYVDTCRNHVWDFDFPTSDHQGDDYNVMVTSVQSGKKFVDIQNGKLCESDQLPI